MTAGEWYINVHTEANPGGEIRGQATPPIVHFECSGQNLTRSVAAGASADGAGSPGVSRVD